MKKIILIAAIAMGGLMLASCSSKKECKCTSVYTGSYNDTSETTTTINGGECSDMNVTTTSNNMTMVRTCVEI